MKDSHSVQLYESMAEIAKELKSLRIAAVQLKEIYTQASEEIDLTFIRIIEEKYETLIQELSRLTEQVTEERSNMNEHIEQEAISHAAM